MTLAAILLLVAAVACVAFELFIPTHGVLGICAILCAAGSVYCAFQVSQFMGFLFGLAIIILAPIVFYWAIRLYPKSPMGKRVMLNTPPSASTDAFAAESGRLSQLIGQRAIASTLLRPAGTIELDGQRINAVSESEIIYPNTPVEIIRVSGLKVIVKAV